MYSLLIAEDEEKLRFIVKEFFVKRGFKVWEAADGEEAVHLAEKRDFDLILLDVMMPNMDGFEACRKIRGKKDVPILFLTARTAEEDQLRGFQLEADDPRPGLRAAQTQEGSRPGQRTESGRDPGESGDPGSAG